MCTEETITLDQLKDGDIVLYELKEEPAFIKPFSKDNLEDNFYVLIDKLICYAENSHVTHAAMVYDHKKIVEATIPTVRITEDIAAPGCNLYIRRVAEEIDGSRVLKFLPQNPQEIEEDPQSYAMMMAVVAGLSCLFKRKIKTSDNIPALTLIVRCILYKVAQYLDKNKIPYANGTENWFCSQLVYYTYTTAAEKLHEPAFEIHLENASTPITDTLIHYLIASTDYSGSTFTDAVIQEPSEMDNLYQIAESFFHPEKSDSTINKTVQKPSKEDVSCIFTSLHKIFGFTWDDDIEHTLTMFQSSFVMPSDLCHCLSQGFSVYEDTI